MKKVLALMLIVIMTLTLAACGGGNKTPEPAPAPAAPTPAPTQAAPAAPSPAAPEPVVANESEDYEDDDTSAYVDAMSDYISAFEELMEEALPALMDATESIETEEDLQEWCVAFIELKDAIGQAADSLADSTGNVPEDYQESHIKITIATAAVYDAMTGFEYAVDAAIAGDEDAFTDGLAQFIGNIIGAEELWDEAVE